MPSRGQGIQWSDVPLSHEDRVKLMKRLQQAMYKKRLWKRRRLYMYEILKRLFLTHGYRMSPDRRSLIHSDARTFPAIELDTVDGNISELDMSRLPTTMERELHAMLVPQRKTKKNDFDVNQVLSMKQVEEKRIRNEEEMNALVKERANLLRAMYPDNPYYDTNNPYDEWSSSFPYSYSSSPSSSKSSSKGTPQSSRTTTPSSSTTSKRTSLSSISSPGSPGYTVQKNVRTGLAEKRPLRPMTPDSGGTSVTELTTDEEEYASPPKTPRSPKRGLKIPEKRKKRSKR